MNQWKRMSYLMVKMQVTPRYVALAECQFLSTSLHHYHLHQVEPKLSLLQCSLLTAKPALALKLQAPADLSSSSALLPSSVVATEAVLMQAVSGSQVASVNGLKLLVGSKNPLLLCLATQYCIYLVKVPQHCHQCCPPCLICLYNKQATNNIN